MARVIVVGGGLAGAEAAWQALREGADVTLYEMRGVKPTPVHQTDKVCRARLLEFCSRAAKSQMQPGSSSRR